MPTAAQVAQTWKAPPPEYGPEPYYGLNGAVDETVIRRDLDTMKALGYQARHGAGWVRYAVCVSVAGVFCVLSHVCW